MRKFLRCEEGGSLVEMALVASMTMAMMIGIIQASLAVYTYHSISEAAREGARYAIVRGAYCTGLTNCNATAAQIQTYVQNLGYDSAANMVVTTTWYSASASLPTSWTACAGVCNDPGDAVQVKVTYNFPFAIPFVQKSTLALSSTSQMVISN
jgi:Flp pilus assembly protein TadG